MQSSRENAPPRPGHKLWGWKFSGKCSDKTRTQDYDIRIVSKCPHGKCDTSKPNKKSGPQGRFLYITQENVNRLQAAGSINFLSGGCGSPAELNDAHACGKEGCCISGNPHAAQRLALRALNLHTLTRNRPEPAQAFTLRSPQSTDRGRSSIHSLSRRQTSWKCTLCFRRSDRISSRGRPGPRSHPCLPLSLQTPAWCCP